MKVAFPRNPGEPYRSYLERAAQEYVMPETLQGVSLPGVEKVLKAINRFSADQRDVVWCLLNDEFSSGFAAKEFALSDGATVHHIAVYVGEFLRKSNKIDREGRDYWLKPLREIGAIEAVTLSKDRVFVEGHIKAKSPNSAYRLNKNFVELMRQANGASFEDNVATWTEDEQVQQRLAVYADLQRQSLRAQSDNPHKNLISLGINVYSKHFLPGYIPVFVDDSDGLRVSEAELEQLAYHNIKLELEDSYPDVIMFNAKERKIWALEAVTSDGEVDQHKLSGLQHIATKSNAILAGATTLYDSWKTCAARQRANRNIALNTFIWIAEDPEKHLLSTRKMKG